MQTVGIDLDDKLKIAFVKKGKGSYRVNCKEIPLSSKSIKLLYKKPTCTGLLANEFLIHDLKINTTSARATKKALAFQINMLSHLKNKVDFPLFLGKDKVSSYFSIFTTTEETIKAHLESYKKLHIDPDFISNIPSALVNFTKYSTDIKKGIILDISKTKTTLVSFEDNQIKKSIAIPLGSNDLLEVETSKKNIDLLSLKIEKNTHLDTFIKKLKNFFFSLEKGKKTVILTGDHAHFDFTTFLNNTFSDWIETINTPKNAQYATAIGLGIERFSPNCIQFRQKGYIAKKFIKKIFARFCTLFAFSIAGSVSLYLIKSNQMNLETARLTQAFEHAYLMDKKSFGEKGDNLSFLQKYSTWNKKLKNSAFPYLFNGPKVSDILSFLENHPLTSTIEIQKVDYKMPSLPRIGNLNSPYKIQVQLEYKASKSNARKFYEEITKNTDFVDQKEKTSWNELSDCYRISFYCKPQTSGTL